MNPQPVTLDQLARLYQARNAANASLSRAMRAKDKPLIEAAKTEATRLNHAYDDALKVYKRQQKKARRDQWRTTMINFYLDARQAI